MLCLKDMVWLGVEMHILLQMDASIFNLHVSVSMSLASELLDKSQSSTLTKSNGTPLTAALIWAALHPAGTCPLFEAFVRGLCEFHPGGSPSYIT